MAGKKPKQPKDIEFESKPAEKAYCVKCRKKNVPMSDTVLTSTFNARQGKWRPMIQGFHSKCGTKLTRFVNEDDAAEIREAA